MGKLLSKLVLIVFLSTVVFGQFSRPVNIEARFVGVVQDLKILGADDQNNVSMWVSADKDYVVTGKGIIPYIYVNDSLYEYWVDYQLKGVGTTRYITIYEIQK
jgi:hypothetical protein